MFVNGPIAHWNIPFGRTNWSHKLAFTNCSRLNRHARRPVRASFEAMKFARFLLSVLNSTAAPSYSRSANSELSCKSVRFRRSAPSICVEIASLAARSAHAYENRGLLHDNLANICPLGYHVHGRSRILTSTSKRGNHSGATHEISKMPTGPA